MREILDDEERFFTNTGRENRRYDYEIPGLNHVFAVLMVKDVYLEIPNHFCPSERNKCGEKRQTVTLSLALLLKIPRDLPYYFV